VEVLPDDLDRALETDARFDRDREKVEDVGEVTTDLCLPLLAALLQPLKRDERSDDREQQRRAEDPRRTPSGGQRDDKSEKRSTAQAHQLDRHELLWGDTLGQAGDRDLPPDTIEVVARQEPTH